MLTPRLTSSPEMGRQGLAVRRFPPSHRPGPAVTANFTKSLMQTIRAFPNCPRRSRSLSSLTMKSEFAAAAHSRIRLSSGSSSMIYRVSVGVTRLASFSNLPRASCSISPDHANLSRSTRKVSCRMGSETSMRIFPALA